MKSPDRTFAVPVMGCEKGSGISTVAAARCEGEEEEEMRSPGEVEAKPPGRNRLKLSGAKGEMGGGPICCTACRLNAAGSLENSCKFKLNVKWVFLLVISLQT